MAYNLLHLHSTELDILDWHHIIESLSSLAHFDPTIKNLQKAIGIKKPAQINFEYDCLQFIYDNFLQKNATLIDDQLSQIPADTHYFDLILLFEKAKVATIGELNFVAILIEQYKNLLKPLADWKMCEKFDINADKISLLQRKFVNEFRKFVSPNGNIDFYRHPILSKIHNQIIALEQETRERLQQLIKSEQYSSSLQFDEYDLLNDHYVVAIRSDSYQSSHGGIIGKSSSGLTLFVEPNELRARGNKRIQLMAELDEAISKICQQFSVIMHDSHSCLLQIQDFILVTDLINSKAKYSYQHGLTRPKLCIEFKIDLYNMFHPLLKNPVKNNIFINYDKNGMIISGPNTGGKTVTLKAISLCFLFLHSGIFLPVDAAEMNPIPNIYYFGNDQQNLTKGLSSFAAETENYLNLLENLNNDSLILIDEIFNSTSSEEASALALSLLEEIHQKCRAKVVISTHHQVLKTHMHSNHSYISSHVTYLLDEKRPTYKINTDGPGNSMAFAVFEQLAQERKIISNIPERAETFLDQKQILYEKLLQELSHKRGEIDKLLRENKEINQNLKNQRKSMEGILQLEKDKKTALLQKEIESIINNAKELLLKAKANELTEKQFHTQAQTIRQKATPQKNSNQLVPPEILSRSCPSLDDIQIGDQYYSISLNKTIKVTAINPRKNGVKIQDKMCSLWEDIQNLRLISNGEKIKGTDRFSIDRTVAGKIELNCRGMRLPLFESEVERALGELLSGEIPFVTIVHGHGDGILKNWLRKYLEKNQSNFIWESPMGNDGCTKIMLR